MLSKNLRRAAAAAILAPALIVGLPSVASAHDSGTGGRLLASIGDDRGEGILSDLVTVNLGRDSDRDDHDDDGILSDLVTVNLGSDDDSDDDGLLDGLLGDDDDGLLSGLLGDDDGLLGLGLL